MLLNNGDDDNHGDGDDDAPRWHSWPLTPLVLPRPIPDHWAGWWWILTMIVVFNDFVPSDDENYGHDDDFEAVKDIKLWNDDDEDWNSDDYDDDDDLKQWWWSESKRLRMMFRKIPS